MEFSEPQRTVTVSCQAHLNPMLPHMYIIKYMGGNIRLRKISDGISAAKDRFANRVLFFHCCSDLLRAIGFKRLCIPVYPVDGLYS